MAFSQNNSSSNNTIRTRDLLLKDHGTVSLPLYTGSERAQTDNFLSKIDDLITVYGQSDAQANRLAIMVIESVPDSPCALWLKAAKLEEEIKGENATHRNLHTWDPQPVGGAPAQPGLRKALEKVYGATTDDTAVFRKLTEFKEQKPSETFLSYFMRRQSAHMEYIAAITPGWRGKTQAQKWTIWEPHQRAVQFEVETCCRPKVRKHIQEIRLSKQIEDIAALTKQVGLWELTDEGVADLKQNKIAPVSAISSQQQQHQQQKRPNPSQQKKGVATSCGYCGIWGHEKSSCRFRQRDEANGIKRDRHDPFPMVSRRQQARKTAESGNKRNSAKGKAVAAIGQQQQSQASTANSSAAHSTNVGQAQGQAFTPIQQPSQQQQQQTQQQRSPQPVGSVGAIRALPPIGSQQMGSATYPLALQYSSNFQDQEQSRRDNLFSDDVFSLHG